MSEIQQPDGPVPPHRVTGTPLPGPGLTGTGLTLPGSGSGNGPGNGSADGGAQEAPASFPAVSGGEEFATRLPDTMEPDEEQHARRAERVVALCFLLAFLAGCGFIAAYIGLEVHSVDATFRSNLALGISLSVALLGLGLGSLLWVRHLMPDVEVVEERHPMRSDDEARQDFQEYAVEAGKASQAGNRKLARRTLMLAGAPLAVAPVVLLRDLGPLPGTSLRHTVWSPGRRLLVYGTNQPVTPGHFSTPGSMISIVPEGYQDNEDAIAKAAVILIKFAPDQLHIPVRKNGKTLLGTMNWTVDNIVAYSKICTHVGCPVALYEETTHHILCPCHQSTFDAAHGAKVIFGPAARPLPQLPMTVDSDGYLVAKSDFHEPVGPSFWERG